MSHTYTDTGMSILIHGFSNVVLNILTAAAKRGIRFKATQHDQIDIIANNIKMIADVSMSKLFPTY